jgi:uncharacterized membrane protein
MDSHNLAQRITAANPNVSNPERWLSVVAGAAIATYGLTRRNISGIVLAAVGSGLVWRGASGHCSVYESLGISTASDTSATNDDHVSVPYGRGIRVEETVTIDAPADRLFAFWRNFENLPRFMEHLKSVTVIDDKRSHWVAKGPAGSDAEWDAVIINEVPNELIGWRSVDGSQVDNAGSVRFSTAPNGRGTIVKVVLRYDPPAGKVGAAIAKLFGEDPAHQVTEELRTFKQLMETGIAA